MKKPFIAGLDDTLLGAVSRSFALSLRALPQAMRPAATLAYVLARCADTVADLSPASPTLRCAWLGAFHRGCKQGLSLETYAQLPELGCTTGGEIKPEEAKLFELLPQWIKCLEQLDKPQRELICEVLATISSGQLLDLERFAHACAASPVALADEAELDDYTWRVAGCVGLFWTRLGFLTLAQKFSKAPQAHLETRGVALGKGLQLVNILRDVGDDLRMGRQYLPAPLAQSWPEALALARGNLRQGLDYAAAMTMARTRLAAALPARIGLDTLNLLERQGLARCMATRQRISRARLRWLVLRSVLKP